MEKQVVVEEPLDPEKGCCGSGCCKPGCCCWPCAVCCSKCCLPRCCKCPSCPSCSGCSGCGCLKKALCFLPRLLCYLPRKLLSCHHLKCLLLVVVVVVLLVVIIAGALLMWLHADQQQVDAVLRMWRGPVWEEDVATFYVDGGDGNPATVIYDYKNLLVSYRSQLHQACYVTHMDKDNIPGLDAVTETFQHRQAEKRLTLPLADCSLLGTTASILCSTLPVYWA